MDIKPLSNNIYFPKDLPQNGKDQTKDQNPKIQDKLELSQEAQNMKKSETQGKNLDQISEKIKNNFYNSDEVINKVAEKIYNEISKTK